MRVDQKNCEASTYKPPTTIAAAKRKINPHRRREQFRRGTRYDKLLANFMGFVKLAAIAIRLKQLNGRHDLGTGSLDGSRASEANVPLHSCC
jgi:hypothetical protein